MRQVHRAASRLAVAFALGVAAALPAAAETVKGWPVKVAANYNITFNGLSFGDFNFSSELSSGQYTLSGDAKLSALLGAFKWRGITRSVGDAKSGGPAPAAYAFSFKGGDKKGRIDMKFAGGAVAKVTVQPPPKPKKLVEVKKEHLAGVLDPLSAIMALAIVPGGGAVDSINPCKRGALKIFDGKQRFDLKFSFKRKERLGDGASAYVCAVRYVPISGYSPGNDETKYMAANTGIEVWLVPVAPARIFVPYQIVLPTWAGDAYVTSDKVVIDTADNKRIAFAQ